MKKREIEEELKEVVKDSIESNNEYSMICSIYEAKENELANIDKTDKEILEREGVDIKSKYIEFQDSLNNIPKAFVETKSKILKSFHNYNEMITYRNAYFNEKYYRNGLKDGARLIIEVFK